MFIHLGVHKFAVAFIILLLFCQLPAVSAFRFRRNVNFEYCWNSTVQFLNTTDYDDERQYFPWDRTHSYRLKLSRPLLSLHGCESLCEDGYELWPADDTLLRVFMWVLPACVLLVHFHFAPLGLGNKIAVITHLLGDPLDTLWSMMTRQEVNRRLYRRANRYRKLGTDFKHVATVWSTYDELGWGDPSPWFANALRVRNLNRRSATPASDGQNVARRSTDQHLRDLNFQETASILLRNLDAGDEILEVDVHGLSEMELYYIQLASHRLACNRSESQLTTWFAILGLLGALCAAFIRTYTQRLNNQTSHTIAVVSLFFVLIPIIKISGNIGSFTSTSIAMEIIQELQHNLENLNPRHPLFPPVQFDYDDFLWDYSSHAKTAQADGEQQALLSSADPRENPSDQENLNLQRNSGLQGTSGPQGNPGLEGHPGSQGYLGPQENSGRERIPSSQADPSSGSPHLIRTSSSTTSSEYVNLEIWPKMAPWAGMNNSWRPCKQLLIVDQSSTEDRGQITLFTISLLFVLFAYFPALILSYRTPTIGFGCRSMAWTFILIMWLCSVGFDQLFKFYIPLGQQLWKYTLVKDATIVFFFVSTIITAQVGLFNSCYCQSTAFQLGKNANLQLGPQSLEDWNAGWPLWVGTPLCFLVAIGGLILIVEKDGENARTLLSRDESERQSDLLLLTKARSRLKKEEL